MTMGTTCPGPRWGVAPGLRTGTGLLHSTISSSETARTSAKRGFASVADCSCGPALRAPSDRRSSSSTFRPQGITSSSSGEGRSDALATGNLPGVVWDRPTLTLHSVGATCSQAPYNILRDPSPCHPGHGPSSKGNYSYPSRPCLPSGWASRCSIIGADAFACGRIRVRRIAPVRFERTLQAVFTEAAGPVPKACWIGQSTIRG